jgi:hypothetical protein
MTRSSGDASEKFRQVLEGKHNHASERRKKRIATFLPSQPDQYM